MKELIVTSQSALDAVSADFDGRIIIKFGTPYNRAVVNRAFKRSVVARDNSSVEAWGNSSVVAWENSSVVARDNSSVVARDNSSVEARGNSSVVAWENSSVVARDNSSVVAWGNSSVVAWENSSVVARDNSSVVARDNSSVVAWDNSSVEAWENSSVEARGNSSVVARDNSSVEARGNSSVMARGNSSVVAWGNSSVMARGNSSVVAWENSSVVAQGNVQVVDAVRRGNIKVSGNARIVRNPDNISDWANCNGIEIAGGKIKLYKAAHKRGGKCISNWDSDFAYTVGEVAESKGFCADPREDCGAGIHMATAAWAVQYGSSWNDLALLELECDADTIVVPLCEPGKVRAPRAKVLREVPLEEAGLMGKIIAKRMVKA